MLGNIVLIFFVKPLNRLTNIPDLRRPSDIKRNLRVKAVAEQMIQFLQLCGGKIDILLGEKQNNQPVIPVFPDQKMNRGRKSNRENCRFGGHNHLVYGCRIDLSPLKTMDIYKHQFCKGGLPNGIAGLPECL